MKLCKVCCIEKELVEFYKRKSCKDGYSTTCKKCEYEAKKIRMTVMTVKKIVPTVSAKTLLNAAMRELNTAHTSGNVEKVISLTAKVTTIAKEVLVEENTTKEQVITYGKSELKYMDDESYINNLRNVVILQASTAVGNVIIPRDNVHIFVHDTRIKIIVSHDDFVVTDDVKTNIKQNIVNVSQ
jgi:hypothetical protein